MGELWQQTSETLWQHPLLWLPVLVADLLGFLVNLARTALLQAALRHDLQYRSVLGGVAMRGPASATAMAHATLIVLVISWTANLLQLCFYAAALVVTAALAAAIMARVRKLSPVVSSALQRSAGGVLALAFQAWVMYLLAFLLFSWLSRALLADGHKALLAGGWLELGCNVLLFAVLAFLLAPAALQILTRSAPAPVPTRQAQWLAFALGVVALMLAHFITANMHAVHIAQPVVAFGLEITGSWIAALPYAVMFVGFGLLAERSKTETA